MAVLITTENPGQTQPGYDGMLNALGPILKQAPGFVLHSAFPVDGGWRVNDASVPADERVGSDLPGE